MSVVTAWWWRELTVSGAPFVADARREPATGRTSSWALTQCSPFFRPSWPGMSWMSLPPWATLSSWKPRQMPSTGTPSSSARSYALNSSSSRGPSMWCEPWFGSP